MNTTAPTDESKAQPIRRRLPNRRACEHLDIDCGSIRYTATIGRFHDGELGEIFIVGAKAGSTADTAARDAAITCSVALQFGADVETIRKALCRDSRGNANGPLGVALDAISGGRK